MAVLLVTRGTPFGSILQKTAEQILPFMAQSHSQHLTQHIGLATEADESWSSEVLYVV
jgi:hypothetical protein